MKKKAIFFRQLSDPISVNLYIGGMGGTITNEATLATYLSCDSSDIDLFSIDANNNIECSINIDFSLNEVSFLNATSLTYFFYTGSNLTEVKRRSFENCTNVKILYFKGCTNFSGSAGGIDRHFRANSNREITYVAQSPTLGYATTNDQMFSSTGVTGQEIFAHPDCETSNGGSVEGDLQTAINNYSAVVTYCTDTSSVPDAVSDLSSTNITTTTVDLTFSTPSSTNSILKYEVWVDGAFWDWISASGGTVTGLSSGTNYDIQVVTCDEFYNRSGFSNIENFTTS